MLTGTPSEDTLEPVSDERHSLTRILLPCGVAVTLAAAALYYVDDPLHARALLIGAVYLTLALSEVVLPFVPTLFLLVATPLLLGTLSTRFQLPAVLGWTADPVIALFVGGFALGLAAERHGLDRAFASVLMRAAGHSQRAWVAVVLLAAAITAMWLSNVAAAALLLAALQPAFASGIDLSFRRALLLALAVGANLGGMATPIGSGPNAIAIAATQAARPITFVHWMAFGTPITFGMLSVGFALIVLLYGVRGKCDITIEAPRTLSTKAKGLLWLFALTIAAWLSEPFHHVNASLVALAVTLLLFATGLLTKRDLGALDWSTLGLIAGGLGLGRLLENTGLLTDLTASIMGTDYPRWVTLGGLVFASATLAALMSNTATAALLVPLGLQLHGGSSTAIIIAIAASFGMPFPISTPPNALVYGTGSLRVADLLVLGLVVMVIGCVVVTLTGAGFLSWLSID